LNNENDLNIFSDTQPNNFNEFDIQDDNLDFTDLLLIYHLKNPDQLSWMQTSYIIGDLLGGSTAIGNLLFRIFGFLALYPHFQDAILQEAKQALENDPEKEMKVGDIPTGVDCSITSLSTDGANLICAGCQFGNVRIYDKRVAHNDSRVLTFRDHCNWITNAYIYPENAKHFHVISGSLSGDVKFWDKRLSNAIKTINVSQGMTTMSVHPEADIFAW